MRANRKRDIGRSLQRKRRASGFRSARDFAEFLGINPCTYTNYEQGSRPLGADMLWRIADALECTIDEVVGRSWPEEQPDILPAMERKELFCAYKLLNRIGRRAALNMIRSLRDGFSSGPPSTDGAISATRGNAVGPAHEF